jgi:biopolymer transport protein TolR
MAGGLAASSRRGGRRSARRSRLSEINVTPFVDVMLVLLIVFMITAPLLTVSIPLELPKTEAEPSASAPDPLTVSVQRDGKIYVQERLVTYEQMTPLLRAIAGERFDTPIFIRGDKGIDWDLMARVLANISSAGFRKLQLVTDTQDVPVGAGGE